MTKAEIVAIKYFFKSQIKHGENYNNRDDYSPLIINDYWENNFNEFVKNLLTND